MTYDLRAEAERILELTGEQARVAVLLTASRKRAEHGIRSLHESAGVVGKFKLPGQGEVRLDGLEPEPKPWIANATEYADYVVQRQPDAVTATIEVPAAQLEAALEVLGFASVPVAKSSIEVSPAFEASHMKAVELERNPAYDDNPTENRYLALDVDTGEVVPGLSGRASDPRLVVVLDKDLKVRLATDAAREDEDVARDMGFGTGADEDADDAELEEEPDVGTPGELPAGWAFPTQAARKQHWWAAGDGRSACGQYGRIGLEVDPEQPDTACAGCLRASLYDLYASDQEKS